jgi:hypothetical protein
MESTSLHGRGWVFPVQPRASSNIYDCKVNCVTPIASSIPTLRTFGTHEQAVDLKREEA